MSEPGIRISAHRFVYGKVVDTPGGPVEPGFEHRPTSISAGLPAELIPRCRPEELLANRSVQTIVHAQQRAQGARIFWPAAAEDRRWMLATCVRARPEAGEREISRTYTQLVTYCFAESDWCRFAPLLIANAGRWLRAEPDTRAVYASEDRPEAVLDETLLPEVPPCALAPLPKPGALLWRLTTAIERADTGLICGPADGIQSAETFLRALACVAALLPKSMRIYLTAAVGLAEPLGDFALQYLPEAPPLPEEPPGLLAQMAGELIQHEPSAGPPQWNCFWRDHQSPGQPTVEYLQALDRLSGWRSPAAARQAIAGVLDCIAAERSVRDLTSWLEGRRPDCPDPPAINRDQTAVGWISTLTGHIRACLADPRETGIERAVLRLATLIDTGAGIGRQELQGRFWARAWLGAANDGGQPHRIAGGPRLSRPVLCWSCLVGSGAADHAADGIGRLCDFAELHAVTRAVRLAREQSPEQTDAISTALDTPAFRARVEDLKRRADRILAVHPETVIDLAQSMPALLAPGPGEDRVGAEAVREVLEAIALAARLRLHAGAGRDPDATLVLDSAEQVLDTLPRPSGSGLAQHRTSKPDALALLLRCFWQQALRRRSEGPDRSTLWADAITGFVGIWAAEKDAGADALRRLFMAIPETYRDLRENRPVTDQGWLTRDQTTDKTVQDLVGACLTETTARIRDPAQRAGFLLRGLPDPSGLAADPSKPIAYLVSRSWKARIHGDLKDKAGDASRLAGEFLPLLAQGLERFLERLAARKPVTGVYRENPTPAHLKAILEIEGVLLGRLADAQAPPPRGPILDLIERTETLANRVPGYQQVTWIPPLIEGVALAFARCVCRWAESAPPEPWLNDIPDTLLKAPIRLALARRLRFPMAAYFGRVTTPYYETLENKSLRQERGQAFGRRVAESLGLSPNTGDQLALVIAPGAARAWRQAFCSGPRGIGFVRRLMQEPASADALDALGLVLRKTPPGYQDLIDPDTRFVIGFFLALGDDGASLAALPMPDDLEKALLSNGRLHDGCYAIALARTIATSCLWNNVRDLTGLFTHRECNSRLARSVMGLSEGGWASFAAIGDAAKRTAILRLLFLLSIVVADWVQGQTWRLKVKDKSLDATLQLAPGDPVVKPVMAGFLARHTDLFDALRDSRKQTRAALAGWPLNGGRDATP